MDHSVYFKHKPRFLLKSIFFAFLFSSFFLTLNPCCQAGLKANPLQPAVAGTFYPADKQELDRMLDLMLGKAPDNALNAHIYGMICPHAGYIYSGEVAAQAYKKLSNYWYKTVVILAPSHYYPLDSVMILAQGSVQTPLGQVSIDQAFAQDLINTNKDLFKQDLNVFTNEHALETQIPFLQKMLKDFQIVPIIIPQTSYSLTQDLAKALTQVVGNREDVLIIASSDMSHYHDLISAKQIDEQTINLILTKNNEYLFDRTDKGKNELCGAAAVVTLMRTMQNLNVDNIALLEYATSADSNFVKNPDLNRVVGYSAIIFAKKNKPNQETETMLNSSQKKVLLDIARKSIVNMVINKQKNIVVTEDAALLEHRGAFVTIYKKDELRGCIGLIEADQPLISVVNNMAIQAATRDPRFLPISVPELERINLEISVMSPIQPITDINMIEVGKHGLIIRRGYNSGLLLPQVASEYNWNRQQFLEQTCIKAGLNKDAWKQKGTEMFIFSAQVFNEEESL